MFKFKKNEENKLVNKKNRITGPFVTFNILIFKFRNIGRSTFGRSKFRPPRQNSI